MPSDRSKESEIIEINPNEMDDFKQSILAELLATALEQKMYYLKKDEILDFEFYDDNQVRTLYKIKFTHDLYHYKKEINANEFQDRYYVVGEKMGEGGEGAVYKITGSLKTIDGYSKFRKRNRVLKISHPKNIKDTVQEIQFSQQAKYLRVTPIEVEKDNKYFSLKKFDTSLYNWLKQIKNEKKTINQDGFFYIARLLFKGLQQIHDNGMVHRDLKPDNIMLSKKDNYIDECHIIDFGLARKENEPDGRVCGTPDYMPDEILSHLVFDAEGNPIKVVKYPSWDATLVGDRAFALDVFAVGKILKELAAQTAFEPVVKKKISSLISEMTMESSKRITLPKAYQNLEMAKFVSSPNHHNANFIKAHEGAINAYNAMREVNKNHATMTNILGSLKNAIMDNINFDSNAMPEFIDTLGVKVLKNCRSKNDVDKTLDNLINNFYTNTDELLLLLTKAESIFNFNIIQPSLVLPDNLQQLNAVKNINEIKKTALALTQGIESVLYKERHYNASFDDVYELNKVLKKGIEKFKTQIAGLWNENRIVYSNLALIDKLEKKEVKDELKALKSAITKAIETYIDATLTEKNLKKKDRAASAKRMKTMQDLTKVFDETTNAKDAERQIQGIMKHSFSFWQPSKLKKELKTNLHEYKKPKK